jgi:hypothetical protein
MTAAKNIVAAKEQQIESTAAIDAQPVIDEEKIDAEVEAENKKANAAMIAFGIGAAGLIASQFDPVKEAFTGVVDFAKGVYGYLKDFISITNSGLETINSMGRSIGLGEKTSTPTSGSPASSNSGNDSASMQSPVATQVSNPQDSANPVQSSAPVATSNGDEIVVTAPRRSTSSSSSSSTSSDEIVVTAPRRSSSRSSSSSSSSSGSSDASRQSAPPPTSAAPVQTNSELSEAQNGTVWAGTDASGMKTFVRKINNKFETWTSTDGTHYDIDESQAQAQISSRGLRNVNTGSDQRQATGQQTIPQNNIVELGRYLQSQGLRISGHSQFGGQERGSHSANSRHYRDMAIDVNVGTGLREADDPTAGARFDKLATDLRAAGYSVIWRAKDHYDHLHVSVGGPESAGSSGEGADSDSSLISNIAKGGWEMTKGAIEAVSNIIRAGAGEYKTTTGSQLTSFDTEMVGKINAAAREKNAAMADAKTTEDVKKVSDPLNLNAKSGSPVVQNLASSADIDQVQKYLTRMGFPKIEYHIQTPKMNVA